MISFVLEDILKIRNALIGLNIDLDKRIIKRTKFSFLCNNLCHLTIVYYWLIQCSLIVLQNSRSHGKGISMACQDVCIKRWSMQHCCLQCTQREYKECLRMLIQDDFWSMYVQLKQEKIKEQSTTCNYVMCAAITYSTPAYGVKLFIIL